MNLIGCSHLSVFFVFMYYRLAGIIDFFIKVMILVSKKLWMQVIQFPHGKKIVQELLYLNIDWNFEACKYSTLLSLDFHRIFYLLKPHHNWNHHTLARIEQPKNGRVMVGSVYNMAFVSYYEKLSRKRWCIGSFCIWYIVIP